MQDSEPNRIFNSLNILWASLVAQMLKTLPAMQEIQVQSLDPEDPLEKIMATHTSILACKTQWTEETGRLQFMERERSDVTEQLTLSLSIFYNALLN